MAQLGTVRLGVAIMVAALGASACSSEVDNPGARNASAGVGGTGGSVPTSPASSGSGGEGGVPVVQDPCDGKPCGAGCCEDPDDPCFSPGNARACDINGVCIEAEAALSSCPGQPDCCESDFQCGDVVYVPCVEGVCKEPVLDACWSDAECPIDCVCQGAFVCPCGYDCDSEDVPGSCACDTGGGGA